MPTTANGLRYPASTDTPDVPRDLGNLAADVEALLDLGAATAWTPVLTGATTNPVLGTGGQAAGWYVKLGRLAVAWGTLAFGTSGASFGSGNWRISLPENAAARANASSFGLITAIDSSAATHYLVAAINGQPTYTEMVAHGSANYVNAVQPFTWATSDVLRFILAFETAA